MKVSYEKVICICCDNDCKRQNSKRLFKLFQKRIRENNLDEKILLLKARCVDKCDHAPVVIVDRKLSTNFKKQDIEECLISS